LCFSHGWYF